MIDLSLVPPAFGILGLVAAAVIFAMVLRYPDGQQKVKEIGDQIHLGAMVFMRREYSMLAIFAAVLIAFLYYFLNAETAIAFIVPSPSTAAR